MNYVSKQVRASQNHGIVHPIDIMNIVLFGATGMVGQGVLRECLLDPGVERVLTVGRAPTSAQHGKLEEIVRKDLFTYADIEDQLSGFDACLVVAQS